MYGEYRDSVELAPADDRSLTPLAALEKAVLPALARPPCLVSFSGGRDSSSVLAAATGAARREGFEPPVPITLRFPDAPMSEESEWQERVVRHLGVCNWEVRHVGEATDLIGPLSAAVLHRHGVLFPFNAFLHTPLFEAARGGSLLGGLGGDHVFVTWRWRTQADVLARRRPPVPRDTLRLLYAASPRALRKVRERRRRPDNPRFWLRPDARRAVDDLEATEAATQPVRWGKWIGWRARRRDLRAARSTMTLLAADTDTLLLHPLVDVGFLAALARTGGRLGFGDRTATMRAVFAETLPDALLTRSTKARFDEVIWRRESREFAQRWDGSGVDQRLVDPMALRREWLKPQPDARTAMLLQSAWLSTAARAVRPNQPAAREAATTGVARAPRRRRPTRRR
jgi:asparagine synthase